MKLKDLIEIGFEVQKCEDDAIYLTLDLGSDYQKLCLISSEYDGEDVEYIEIFEYNSFKFTDIESVKQLIKILKLNEKTI